MLIDSAPRESSWGAPSDSIRPSTGQKTLRRVRCMALAPIVSIFDQIVDLWAIRRMNNAEKTARNRFRDLLDRW
jgi:hypothetical protein